MHIPTFITTTTLTALAFASPINKRAGGPSITPIPSNCTITNTLPDAANATNSGQESGYQPSTDFSTTHLVYSSYFEATMNQSAEVQQCLEQCYGYDGGEGKGCKAGMLAYDVEVPEGYYGGSGGELATACLMFDEFLEAQDFVLAGEGRWANETVGNIAC